MTGNKMPTPEQLKQKTKELIAQNKLEFINCEPIIENYGRDRKGEWVVLDGQKYHFINQERAIK